MLSYDVLHSVICSSQICRICRFAFDILIIELFLKITHNNVTQGQQLSRNTAFQKHSHMAEIHFKYEVTLNVGNVQYVNEVTLNVDNVHYVNEVTLNVDNVQYVNEVTLNVGNIQ